MCEHHLSAYFFFLPLASPSSFLGCWKRGTAGMSMIIALRSKLPTVSLGCAPTSSHFFIAGALRLVSFRSGS